MKSIKVLLIEDSPTCALMIRTMLSEVKVAEFELESADRLSTGLNRLAQGGIDVVLLDLTLPDSQGLDTVARTQAQAGGVPIVVLTDPDLGLTEEPSGA